LSKAINGDGKAAPGPLFKIEIILEPKTVGDTTLSRVYFHFSSFKIYQICLLNRSILNLI
jgi:hypothetical protein